MAASKNYYEEIGVSKNASTDEIINAVKQLVKANQPDNFSDVKERENAQQRLRMIKRAYETLKDENSRFEYDLSLVEATTDNSSPQPKRKVSSFKVISSLILGTAAITAGATVYLSNLDCSNQRNVVDATICEKTKPVRSLFGSVEKSPVVEESTAESEKTVSQDAVIEQAKPIDEKLPSAEVAITPEIEQPKSSEPAPALASASVSFDNSSASTPVKSEPESPIATASFQSATTSASTNNSNDECYNLWYQRNLIHAKKGYCFESNLGKKAFSNFQCSSTPQPLSDKEKSDVNNIKNRESALNCKIDTNTIEIPVSNSSQTLNSTNTNQSVNASPIQTLIIDGVGTTPQEAAQNAAENALKNVVGSFIDSNMNLEKKTLIYDGLKSESKNISKDIKEYSQGSIKSFENLETKQESGLYRVKAKVTVSNERFSAYIRQLAKGEGQITEDTKTKALIDIKQKGNLKEIITKNIIEPILSGTVQDIKVSPVSLLSDAIKEKKLPEDILNSIHQNSAFDSSNLYIIFQVDVALKDEFITNIEKVFSEIALKDEEIKRGYNSRYVSRKEKEKENYKILYSSYFDDKISRYLEFDIDVREIFTQVEIHKTLNFGITINGKREELRIILKDNQNKSLQIEDVNSCWRGPYINENSASCLVSNGDYTPWILYRNYDWVSERIESILLKKNSFFVYVKTTPDIFSKLKTVKVELN